jgi:glycosidase/fibronectin type 3 domain-containing protein
VQMRLYNDRTNVEKMVDMTSVYDDGTYEWWQYDLAVGDDPTVYWYRFVVMDGTAMGYYEDDDERLGGLGELFDESQDNSWQLTVYDPAYATPDWIKEAVVYQIFTDRFRDGDPTNNTPAGSFFYEEATTINRSTGTAWNTPICDPRDDFGICPETYSQNFYGGDLQGIIDKLEYLDNLGVTVLYLNPIFESPSNHKYDTTDYSVIDDNYGDLYLFQTLVAEANARGIKVILDGVFNHTSSDSIYFDRYGRYDSIGACESPDSPYRDWYYFEDVEPGTGPCVGSDGTLEAADYESWWGYESLPKLKANSDEVRELIWDGGPDSIARYWVAPAQGAAGWRLDVGGDVDPGTINDPENDYWEGFREAVHLTNPDAYILGEEWGNASSWVLGGEWDGVMNYQYSTAMLGFWRDTDFTDNDHNANSSAGVIEPLTPTELDEHLLNWIERYPPEALYAMMNLLGSHDTNRPLFMLDHDAAEGTDDTLLNNPNYDWSDSVERLMGVVILQMTLPGAPTIYYGDEVGAVGPVTYDNGKWEDDPYNRVPYPWLDESGSPFYTFLRDYKNQTDLYNYYTLLIGARNEHPALSTGSFDTLLTDDDEKIYAYGRKLADNSDAAIVIINRNKSPNLGKNVTLDVSGYLPVGASFENVLDTPVSLNAYGDKYNVDANGEITIYVPPMDGVILVLDYPAAAPPATVTDLAVTAELSKALDLAWSAVVGADSYDVYRSRLNGGGYEMIDNVVGTTYNDTDLTNAVPYYYVVVARDDTTGLVSGYSNEAMGIPHYDLSVAYYELTAPDEITHTISTITPTEAISAQLWINDITGGAGPAEGIMFQIGYGFSSTLPADLTWVDMAYAAAVGDNDEFTGTLLPDYLGEYIYVVQVSSDGGRSWFYADLGGPGDNGQPGKLHVVPSDDLEAPAAPLNLELDRTTASSISFFWSANTEDDLAGYEIYRQHVEAALAAPQAFERIGRVESDTTDYKDSTVETGETYDYYVLAFDTSFNRSPESNILTATAEDRPVTVTLTVTVPAFTPGTVYFSREIDEVAHLAGDWDPAGVELNQVDETTWTTQLVLLDASETEFKFTRGNWETVEKEADGNTEINNRRLVVDYGDDGTQTVSYTVANWRDPIVVATDPVDDEFGVILNKIITVEWSQAMPPDTEFVVETVEGPVLGTYGYDDATFTSIFIPTGELEEGKTYTVTVAGLQDAGGDWQIVDVEFSFSTPFSAYFPLIFTGYIPEPFTP